ncbi:CYTH domain-containing protein [Cellulosilyticum ruminicola]|uniref:CYTH domain-containing protein n=1 Tax=Cellulosilyticum ruminicola TaxID=425254 RepID=UPI0006D28E12|nr:CYTH domain-containing protein [Cellulosilyticum ruminicola]
MEIERKYLVKNLPDLSLYTYKKLTQAYISTKPVIRLRQMNEDFFLTVKSAGHLIRNEFEMPISHEEYLSLLNKVEGTAIEKTRYYIPLTNNLTAELDLYHGFLEGLLTVEVEFNSEEAANIFTAPNWFGEDITFDARYKNNQLALHGKP